MLKRFSSLAAILILLGSMCVSTDAQVSAEPGEVTTGAITGRVVNERGEPMSGATVFVRTIGALSQNRTTI
ncbi:MAG TPA: hypothetical protein VFB65_03145, partial [Pyrinomonadaceae bacterium]|nr:hypothetical protein [Pyrinomonadaceae bacterium]